MLTWANINFSSLNNYQRKKLEDFSNNVYTKLNKKIEILGFETSKEGYRGDAYLYCMEATCPECSMRIPLSPTWVIGQGSKTVAILVKGEKSYLIKVKSKI